jgi:hypothetical protein
MRLLFTTDGTREEVEPIMGLAEREGSGHHVFGFEDIDRTKIALVGGKGANLGEISRIEGIRVPEGFCVFPPLPSRESSGKRCRLMNYLIGYRFSKRGTGTKSASSAVRFACSSKA